MNKSNIISLIILFYIFSNVYCSHFRYATYNWERVGTTGRTIRFFTEQSRRWSYGWYPYRQIGQTMDISSEDANLKWKWGDGGISNHIITVTSFDDKEDWVIGSQTIDHTYASAATYTIRMYSCCRIGTLKDTNAHKWYQTEFTVNTNFGSPGIPTRSTKATALPIIYIQGGVSTSFILPTVASNSAQSTVFSYTNPSGNSVPPPAGTSGLWTKQPGGSGGMQLSSSDGRITWTPPNPTSTCDPHKPDICSLYATQFKMSDGVNFVTLDLLFKVVEDQVGNSNPTFDPVDPPTYDMFIGLELRFDVVAVDSDSGDHPSIISGNIPNGATLSTGCKEGNTGPTCTREFRWTPGLGQTAVDVCFTANDLNGGNSQGLYCIKIREGAAQLLFLTGIIRDINLPTMPDFNRAAVSNEPAFVKQQIGADGKPQYDENNNSGSSTSTKANFDYWWNTDAGYNKQTVHSITLTNAKTTDKRIFTFESSQFFPIDGLLYDEGSQDHNKFFTYEIHSDLTYTEDGGEVFEYATSDDLWIFINGKLALDLRGIHSTPKTGSISLDSLQSSHGIIKGKTYRVDIFYAHRGSSTTPALTLQINEAAVCNAISTGITDVNFGKTVGFNAGSDTNKLKMQGQMALNGIQGTDLRLISSSYSGSSSVWFSEYINNVVTPKRIKFLNGFRCEFGFKVTTGSGAEGFAFVLQDNSQTARGDSGAKLGYDPIPKSLAIEFDMKVDANYNDPNRQHVSIHTRNSLDPNSADELYSIGVTSAPSEPINQLNFKNGTEHHVAIEYVPAYDDNSGGPLLGWIRVYLGTENDKSVQVVPFVQGQVDGRILRTMFPGNGGYVGFTGASTSSLPNTIDITYWTFTAVPLSAAATNAIQAPSNVVAGNTGSFKVQARDACGNKISIGGELSKFTAVMGPAAGVVQDIGPPSPIVNVDITDNDDGTYTFSYDPVVAAPVQIEVKLDNLRISGSPFTFEVESAETSVAKSRFVIEPQLVEKYSNKPTATNGIWVVRFDNNGKVESSSEFDTTKTQDVNALTSFLNAHSGTAAIVIRGSAWSTYPAGTDGNNLETAFNTYGCTGIRSVAQDQSYACIGSSTSAFSAIFEHGTTARTSRLQKEFGTGNTAYFIEARSAGKTQGNQGYIQSYPKQQAQPAAGDDITLTIMAVDAYDNLKNTLVPDAFEMSFVPAMTVVQNLALNTGYYTGKFKSITALTHSVYVRLSSDLPTSPFSVKIEGSIADPSKTTLTGTGVSQGTVGTTGFFDIHLKDEFNNIVVKDTNTIAAELKKDAITVTAQPVGGGTGWDSNTNSYKYQYDVSKSGEYTIYVTINQQVATSATWKPYINPGSVSAANCVFVTTPTNVKAGVTSSFNIQERDIQDNNLIVGVTPTVQFTGGTIEGSPIITSLGSGLYQIDFVAENVVSNYNVDVKVNGVSISNSPTQFAVEVGDLSAVSSIDNAASSVVHNNQFTITAKDRLGNPRTGGGDHASFTVDIRTLSDIVPSSIEILPSSNQHYTVNWTSIIAGSFLVSVSLNDVGPIQGSGTTTINLLSGPTHFQHVETNGPGLIGGVQNTIVEFTIQARDVYDNNRDNSNDVFTLTITPLSSSAYNGNITLISPGVYKGSYVVPTWSISETTFTIDLQLTSGPAGTTTGQILSSQGTIKEADAETCAILNPIPSILAGENSQFNLVPTCCNDNPSCVIDNQNYRIEVQGTNSLSGTFQCKRQDPVSGDSSCTVNHQSANDPYEITIKNTIKSGEYTVRIFVDGLYEINATRTSPPLLVVSPNVLNAQKSVVTGFPKSKVVGTTGNFSVELRDIYSNKITSGSYNVILDVSDQPNLISAQAIKQPNNLYVGTYSSEKINTYNPAIKANGADIGPLGKRYSITYTYDIPSPTKSTVDTSGLTTGLIAGDTFTVYVQVKDKFDNIHSSGTVNVSAWLTNQNGGFVSVSPIFSTSYEATPKRYRIVGRTITSGYQHKLYIYINNKLTSGSPYLFDILSGSISDTHTIQNVGLSNVVAGTTVQYQIHARDIYNNPWTGSTLSVVAANFEDTKSCNVVKSDTGIFDVTFEQATTASVYTFYTSSGATQLGNAPSITVSHNIPYGGNTKTDGAIVNGKIDEINQITFATYDFYDNEITNSTTPSSYYVNFTIDRVDCAEEGGDDDSTINANLATTISSSVSYNAPNKYTISYNGTEVGEYTVHFTVAGTKMQCSNLPVISLSPGTALASNTLMEGNGLAGGVSGDVLKIKIFLRDRFGNSVSDDTATIVITDGPGSGPFLTNAVVDDLTTVFVPYQAITKENAHWLVTYKAKIKGNYEFYATLNGIQMPTPTSDKIVITPGPASTFARSPLSPIETATYSSYITVTGTDQAGNLVDDNGASAYTLEATHNEMSEPQYKFYGVLSYHGSGVYHLTYRGTFAGNYTSVIKVSLGNNVVEQDFQISLKAALCGGQSSNTPYRCPDNTCVSSYDQCNSLFTRCPQGQVQCELDDVSNAPTCVTDSRLCPCPNGQQRCAAGHCDVECLEPVLCTEEFPYECYRGGSFYGCRKSQADCPTDLVCPYGFFVCDSGLSCGTYKTNQTCIDLGNQADDCRYSTCLNIIDKQCPDGYKKCSSGSCVASLQDCPTEITCPNGLVLCMDRTCKSNIDECAEIGDCIDINGKPLVTCNDGSCRTTIDECPTSVTCPSGYILCSHGECVETISKCNSTFTSCPIDKYRCGDGTCVENRLLCPTKITCSEDFPVLCPNNECVRTVDNCAAPVECADDKIRCPSCEICVIANETDSSCCSTTTCSETTPVLCPDRVSCVKTINDCNDVEECEFDLPIRCPDGSCRSTINDCPTVVSCSPKIRCEDGTCAISADTCYGSNENQTVSTSCTDNRIRCPDGSCALSLDVCPSTITCPDYTIRCSDGTCRENEIDCPSTSSCPVGTAKCPSPDYGLLCVSDLNDCPQSIICPSQTPVRCMDTSCAATEDDCVKPENSTSIITTSKVVCPDGGFETEAEICGTPVTCPQCAPFKCWDDTCRLHPDDCPAMPKCTGTTPYVCPDGTCVSKLYFCRSVSARCEDDTAIMCPDNTCVVSAKNCSCPYFPTDVENSDNDIFCPHGMARCHDSSCRKRSTTCEDFSCPPHLPIICDDGMCASSKSQCKDLNTGCPADKPLNCSGACVKNEPVNNVYFGCALIDAYLLNNSPCPDAEVRCPDGSCAGALNQCPEANGCFKNYMRCHDKRCVRKPKTLDRYNPCLTASTSANLCPASRPIRCPRGFCSISRLHCPPSLSSSTLNKCPIDTPVRCDDGSCRISAENCPVIYPCSAETGTARCLDGSCRAVDSECPVYDSVSCELAGDLCCPKRHIRCQNGLCAKLPDNCDDNGKGCANAYDNCFNVTTGCPPNQQRCTTNNRMAGLCVDNIETDCTPLTLSKESNGCDSSNKFKCEFTGRCTNTYANCSHPQTLCSLDKPVRCYNGECVAKASTCFSSPYNETCSNVLCADGACVNELSECNTQQGCSILKPIRCKDGSCHKFMSGTNDDSCPPVTTCNSGDVLCSDGSCASDPKYCSSSVPHPSCTNDKPHICPDGTCVRFLDECPNIKVCPPIQPVTCKDGTCRKHVNECPQPNSRCKNDEYRCFDGTCVLLTDKHSCVKRHVLVNYDENDLSSTDGDETCGTNMVLCSDSTCVTDRRMCDVTTSCKPEQWRCGDGKCSDTSCTYTNCGSGKKRCPDGVCRVTCPAYDGCPLSAPYLCKNLQCRSGPSQCTPLLEGESNCYKNCKRSIKARNLIYTLSKESSSYVNIAYNKSSIVSQLLIPSGSIIRNAEDEILNTIQVFPVGENQINSIGNPVDSYRIAELQSSGFNIDTTNPNLNFTSSVLSPAFSCKVDEKVIQPFPIKLSFYSLIDLTMNIEYDDICLAKIVTIEGENQWQCLDSLDERRMYSVHAENAPENWVNGTLSECNQNTIYAFVHIPLQPVLPAERQSDNWFKNNWYIVFPSIIGGGIVVAGLWLLFVRWYSFRKRLHALRVKRDDLKEKVNDAEEFGVREDSDLVMMKNPLGQNIENMKGVMSTNVDDIELLETNQMRLDVGAEIDQQQQEIDMYEQQLQQLRRDVQFNRPRGETDEQPQLRQQPLPFFEPPPLKATSSFDETVDERDTQTAFSARPKKRNF